MLAGVADGAEGLVLADLARAVAAGAARARDQPRRWSAATAPRMAALSRALAFFAPDIEVLRIPGLGLPALRPRVAACRRSWRSA